MPLAVLPSTVFITPPSGNNQLTVPHDEYQPAALYQVWLDASPKTVPLSLDQTLLPATAATTEPTNTLDLKSASQPIGTGYILNL